MEAENLLERIVLTEAKARAAHERVDKLEVGIKEDLKEIKQELKFVVAHMHESKGKALALFVLFGLMGGVVSQIILRLFKV